MPKAEKIEKPNPPIKAYTVRETDEGTGGILFAHYAIVAHRNGASEWGNGDLSSVECRRTPWADAYAETGIPARVMVEHGWWFECFGCGIKISEEEFHDRRMDTAGIIGTQHGRIYCCARCKWRDKRLEAKSIALRREVFEIHKNIALKKLPGIKVLNLDANPGSRVDVSFEPGGWNWYYINIQFKFPGMSVAPAEMKTVRQYGKTAAFTPQRPQFYCCSGDREAFEAFAAACKEARHA
jgi:hypothetical protein